MDSAVAANTRKYDPIGARVGQTIKVVLKARGRTIKWLATEVGIKESSLYDRLAGHVDISVPELMRIAAALEVDPGILCRDSETLIGSFCPPLALVSDVAYPAQLTLDDELATQSLRALLRPVPPS